MGKLAHLAEVGWRRGEVVDHDASAHLLHPLEHFLLLRHHATPLAHEGRAACQRLRDGAWARLANYHVCAAHVVPHLCTEESVTRSGRGKGCHASLGVGQVRCPPRDAPHRALVQVSVCVIEQSSLQCG